MRSRRRSTLTDSAGLPEQRAPAQELLVGRLPSLAEFAEFLAPYARCVAFTKPNEDHHIPIRDSALSGRAIVFMASYRLMHTTERPERPFAVARPREQPRVHVTRYSRAAKKFHISTPAPRSWFAVTGRYRL